MNGSHQDPKDEKIKTLEEQIKGFQKREQQRKENQVDRFRLLGRFGSHLFLGPDLKASTIKLFTDENPKGSLEYRRTIGHFLAALIRRFTRIGVFAAIVAMAPIILLFQQNGLIGKQNEKIESQTTLIRNQNLLLEADRRAALIYELTSILDEIDEEMDQAGYQLDAIRTRYVSQEAGSTTLEDVRPNRRNSDSLGLFRLSDRLAGRIVSLTRSLKPYRFINEDGIPIGKPLSPEKGQLFTSMLDSGIDMEDLNHNIGIDFSSSDLSNVYLLDAELTHSRLQNSNFMNASIFGVFDYASLDSCNFKNASLGGKLRYLSMTHCDFRAAKLVSCELDDADLSYSDLRGADIRDIKNWYGMKVTNTNIAKVQNMPEGFREWALENGAVELEDDLDWNNFVKNGWKR
tara:strand:- start:10548 stop:11756 length:1209 start_codon:yes stop_codon:yes gene_type:complete